MIITVESFHCFVIVGQSFVYSQSVYSGGSHSYRLCSHNCNRCWLMVKATQMGVVSSQSALRNTGNADNGWLQCGMAGLLCKNIRPQFVTRALFRRLGLSSRL